MSEVGSATEMRHLAASRGPVKNSPNLSGGWVVMLLSGLIAAVLFLFATQQSSSKVPVVVLSKPVSAGQVLDESFFGRSEVSAADSQLQKLIPFSDRDQFKGFVASGPFDSGDLLPKSALREPAATAQRRSMSIPVDKTHANNGNLRPGDRIDVINPENPDGYVAKSVEVLSVSETGGTSGIGTGVQFTVIAAVDEGQAVKISQAIRTGKFDIVRTTGATTTPAPASASPSTTTTTAKPTNGGEQ